MTKDHSLTDSGFTIDLRPPLPLPLLLDRSAFIDSVDVSLVQIDEKHQVISEHTQSVHSGHLDDECKQVWRGEIKSTEISKY